MSVLINRQAAVELIYGLVTDESVKDELVTKIYNLPTGRSALWVSSNKADGMKTWNIYEEGFRVMEGEGRAYYLGEAEGKTFLEACKKYIERSGFGNIYTDQDTGEEYAGNWGCRWFPTLEEAQQSFG